MNIFKFKHKESEEEKQARINKKLYGDLTPEQYLKKHDIEAQPSSKLWAARNQILKILHENNLHIEIGSDSIVTAKAGVTKSFPEKSIIVGIPAMPRKDFIKQLKTMKDAQEIFAKFRKYEPLLKEFEDNIGK